MSAKPKPIKMGESLPFEVDGMTVVLKRVEPTYYQWSSDPSRGPAEQKSRHEILVNEKHFGWINCPSGFGAGWQIVGHGRATETDHAWARLHEMQNPWVVYPKKDQLSREPTSRDSLVAMVPDLIRRGALVSRERMDELIAKRVRYEEQVKRERQAEEAKHEARRAREKIETRERRKAERETILDRITGLESVLDRMRGDMTNSEVVAVSGCLDALRRELEIHDGHTAAFYDDEHQGR